MAVLDEAMKYIKGGISLVPVGTDGLKQPASSVLPPGENGKPSWNPLRSRLPTDAEAGRWWGGPSPAGLAAVCGAASGNLEVIDFDNQCADIFPRWMAAVEEQAPELLLRVAVVDSPRPGVHVWLRCAGPVPGNLKLASDPARPPREQTLIETRGEGGYCLVPGGPDSVHETGRPYRHRSEDLHVYGLAPLTAEEREVLIGTARYFDLAAKQKAASTPQTIPGDVRPGDDFAKNTTWEEILGRHGWRVAGRCGDELRWARPDKDKGWSATTGHCKGKDGEDLLYVFSSSCHPLEAGHAYGKFRAYAALEFSGDLARAAAFLRSQGWGTGKPASQAKKATPHTTSAPAEPTAEEDAMEVATIDDLAKAGAEVTWLWPGWMPEGVLVAMAAEGGTGKTRFCADIIRRIRKGMPWPDGHPMALPPDSKALWVVSDNHHDEMVTLSRTFGIEHNVMINAWKGDPYAGVSLESDEDFRALELRVRKVKPVLVIVDTVGNATDRNLSKQEDARAFYMPLQVIARRHRCTILCLTHLNTNGKFLGRRVMEKVRVAICMEKPDPDDKRRSLAVVKSNSKRPEPLGVTMGDDGNEYDPTPPKAPDGEPGHPQQGGGKGQGKGGGRPVDGKSIDWLKARLARGPVAVAPLRREWEEEGISTYAAYAARDKIAEEYEDNGRKWWRLKQDDSPTAGPA